MHQIERAMAAQLPDRILLDGEIMDLFSNPLEQYWIRYEKKRPPFYPLPDCIRGYVANWEIRGGQLFLRGIDGNFEKRTIFFGVESARYSIKTLFPRANNRPVKASWYSGKLRIPRGKMTIYQHQDYNSRFEQEIIITVDKGEVIKIVTLDYDKKLLVVNQPLKARTHA